MKRFWTVMLATLFVGVSSIVAQAQQPSADLGDVRVAVNSVRTLSENDARLLGFQPRRHYQIVLVSVTFTNISQSPSCADLDEWLTVKEGYEYPAVYLNQVNPQFNSPQSNHLAPSEQSSGAFAFEIKNGFHPEEIQFDRLAMGENICAQSQHREISGASTATLFLKGLVLAKLK